MLIGFSKHGTGEGSQPIRYLTAETVSTRAIQYLTGQQRRKGLRRDPQPVVVRGDPIQTRALIDSLKFKNKYTSGVLSFAPGEVITPAMERYSMDEFERVAFAGLDRDQYTVLFVRHTHTASHRHEIHFVLPRVELSTGKSLNIAPPGAATRQLFDTLRSKINAEFGLADPDDPARAQREKLSGYRAKIRALQTQHSNPNGKAQRQMTQASKPSPDRAKELEGNLANLVAKRAAYNRSRYAAWAIEPNSTLPIYDRTRIPPVGSRQTARSGISGARSDAFQTLAGLGNATDRWGEAHRSLDRAGEHFDRADRAIAAGLEQTIATCEHQQQHNEFLRRYNLSVMETVAANNHERVAEPEPEMEMELP